MTTWRTMFHVWPDAGRGQSVVDALVEEARSSAESRGLTIVSEPIVSREDFWLEDGKYPGPGTVIVEFRVIEPMMDRLA